MSSGVIICHTIRYFTTVYTVIILQSQNRWTAWNIFRRTAARRSRRAAIRWRWILCSNEQSKLCFCTTESILPYKNQLALPNGREIFLQSRKIWRRKKNNPKAEKHGEKTGKKDRQKTEDWSGGLQVQFPSERTGEKQIWKTVSGIRSKGQDNLYVSIR